MYNRNVCYTERPPEHNEVSLPVAHSDPTPPSPGPSSDGSNVHVRVGKATNGSDRLLKQGGGEPKSRRTELANAFARGSHPSLTNASGLNMFEGSQDTTHTEPSHPTGDGELKHPEYGTVAHVQQVIGGRNEKGSKFLSRAWQPRKSDKEVMLWTEKLTLSKKNKEKLSGGRTHVQNWHSSRSASEQARLDNVLVEWGLLFRDASKLKAHSKLRILSVATVLVA